MQSKTKVYLCADLGAGSGRVMAGIFDGEKIQIKELNRFSNLPITLANSICWNLPELFNNIKEGIALGIKEFQDDIVSFGVDTWGVDYGLLDKDNQLISLPQIYRSPRTEGMMDKVFEKISNEELYSNTGIQTMFFNTVFQMMSEKELSPWRIENASNLLLIPDLIAYLLTGQIKTERTNASTTALYNPVTKDWAWQVIEKLGFPKNIFSSFVNAGEKVGDFTDEIAKELGKKLPLIATGTHDTASAVAAVPSLDEVPCYISSGTWSLMGLRLNEPVMSAQAQKANFTNEIGVQDTVRFLKNITGMWLMQQSKAFWDSQEEGVSYSYAQLEDEASKAKTFTFFIDGDSPDFALAGNMPKKIQDFCKKTGQEVPQTRGEIVRAIYESLAFKYRLTLETLENLSGKKVQSINIVGGGSKDSVLNQATANATGKRVIAGPTEATSLGNILMQMKADKSISSNEEGTKIIMNSQETKFFEPKDTDIWTSKFEDWKKIVGK